METGVFNITIRNVLANSANKKVKAVQLLAQQAPGGGSQCHIPAGLLLAKRPGTHYTGGWVGSVARLYGSGKSS